jgi:hypothetical protein
MTLAEQDIRLRIPERSMRLPLNAVEEVNRASTLVPQAVEVLDCWRTRFGLNRLRAVLGRPRASFV